MKSCLALLAALLLAGPAAAQSRTPLSFEPETTGAVPRGQSVDQRLAIRKRSASDFALDYLAAWSSANPTAVGSVRHFYGPTVQFHGSRLSADALAGVKRRFAQRWPERSYRHRPETIEVRCDMDTDLCRVSSIFDYEALNPATGRRARGSERFELGISFAGGRPVIVSETSRKVRV